MLRMGIVALISHFAYCFAFGINMVPFSTGIFNQTSVMYPLFFAILVMWMKDSDLQMKEMFLFVAIYLAVSFLFVSKGYALVQIGVLLVYPVLMLYNGEKGTAKWMKCFFYLYYPLHLILIGALRICIHGDISLLF